MDLLTDESELTTVRLPLTQELREYLVSCTDRHRPWRRFPVLVAGVALWILAIATWNATFLAVGIILVVFFHFFSVSGEGAREDLSANVFLKSTGWVVIEAELDGEFNDYCAVDMGDRRLRLPISVREAKDIAQILREQPIFSRPDASPTSMLVWSEVLWLPHLDQLIALRDGAGRVVYADQRFRTSANV